MQPVFDAHCYFKEFADKRDTKDVDSLRIIINHLGGFMSGPVTNIQQESYTVQDSANQKDPRATHKIVGTKDESKVLLLKGEKKIVLFDIKKLDVVD